MNEEQGVRKAEPFPGTFALDPDHFTRLREAIDRIDEMVGELRKRRSVRRAMQELRCAAGELCVAAGLPQFYLGKAAGFIAAGREDLLDRNILVKEIFLREQVRKLMASANRAGTSFPESAGASCQI